MSTLTKVQGVPDLITDAYINQSSYRELYDSSLADPKKFWGEQARKFLTWSKPFSKVKDTSFGPEQIHIRWFWDGELNVCVNCVDRHLPHRGNQTAIIWEPDTPGASKKITYNELHRSVCRFANLLEQHGVRKGDRVTIYLPMIPEATYAMLACARIGAIHSVVFGGFSPEALAGRIEDCGSKFIITADAGLRGGKQIPLKANVDQAVAKCPSVEQVLVIERVGNPIEMIAGRDISYNAAIARQPVTHQAAAMNAEDPLFILYTSGSTGKPKGVLHTSGGYLLYAAMTHRYVFDYRDGDVYWCTADVGWITGHSYIVYGPLCNGATTLMFEGVPNYPDVGRFWQVVDQHQVNIFYTAPTAIRALMREGDEPVLKTSRASLKILGTVGEPINPEAWNWYYRVVGNGKVPIVDTWWQTETGGIMITPLPGAIPAKPGAATLPFFGIKPELVDDQGKTLTGEASGLLCLTDSWPGQMRTVYGDPQKFHDTYFAKFAGKYFTGDGAHRDADGYYWITGRVDDVLNISGHRLGTAEIESALVGHHAVAEAAVVGYPDKIKGQGIYCYVTLKIGIDATDALRAELIQAVRTALGPIATPDVIQWSPGLPKTRSGKIMRRILRKIATNDYDTLGDISTLADPGVVKTLIANRANN